jgi:hypothetical protein
MKHCLHKSFLLASIAVLWMQTAALAQQNAPEAGRSPIESRMPAGGSTDYFPLQVGNEWIYSDGLKVRVRREVQEANGNKYFEIAGYFAEYPAQVQKVRRGPLGQVLEYNPDGEDFLWYRFGLSKNPWILETGENKACITGSRVTSHISGNEVEVPAGAFGNTMRIDFEPQCADMGITNEYFARGVGLVRRVWQTIAGPRPVGLVSARVGSLELPKAFFGIEVRMDKPLYYNNLMPPIDKPWPAARVMLVVRNQTEIPVDFTFPTSQRFDFIVQDELGNEVLRWSQGKMFTQAIEKETLVNESRRFPAEIVLQKTDGGTLPAGFYTLTGYLTLAKWEPGYQKMMGTMTFEIRDAY